MYRRAPILLYFVLLATLTFAIGTAVWQTPFAADPGRLTFGAEGGTALVNLQGRNASQVTSLRVLHNGAVDPKFKTVRVKGDPTVQLPTFGIAASPGVAPGTTYRLEALAGKTWSPVLCSITVKAAAAKVAPRKFALPTLKKKDPVPQSSLLAALRANKYLASSAEASRASKLLAAVDELNADAPVIQDWFPKEKGAIGGTLVLIGKKLDGVVAVSLGNTDLPIIQRKKTFSADSIVVQLPSSAALGALSYTRRMGTTNAKLPIENSFQLVDQFSSAWPHPRATILSVSGNPLYQNKPHANMLYNFYLLLEYMPGNVLSDFDPISGANAIVPSNEVVGGINRVDATTQPDASGHVFINGNAVVIGVVGWCPLNNAPSSAEVSRKVGFDVKSYLNTASAQNSVLNTRFETTCNFATPIELTISDTYSLKSFFNFTLFNSFGTAEGVSSTLGGSDVSVGLINRSGDLAFRIASGPFGTRADWVSHPFSMPEGWIIEAENWKVKHDFPSGDYPKAKSASNGFQDYFAMFRPLFNLPYDYRRDVNSCYADNYVIGGAIQPPYKSSDIFSVSNVIRTVKYSFTFDITREKTGMPYIMNEIFLPRGVRDARQNVKGNFVGLKAQATAINDHRVTTFLDSIRLLAPRGSTSATGWISGVTKYAPDDNFKGPTPFGPTLPEYYFLKDGIF